MDLVQGALIAAVSSLLTGGGVYIGFARSVLTRTEHKEECKSNLAPIEKEIKKINECTLRIEERHAKSSQELQKELQAIALELARMNGKQHKTEGK